MNNKPIAYAMFRNGEYYDAIHPDEQAKTVGEYDIPLYTHPAKYCPSEDNPAYEKGFIDGMQKQMQSSVDRFINGCACGEPLALNTVHRKDNPCYVKEELTDEEILEVWRENDRVYPMDRSRLLDRTRACIRKAQEK
jgi:hypothetical protein